MYERETERKWMNDERPRVLNAGRDYCSKKLIKRVRLYELIREDMNEGRTKPRHDVLDRDIFSF